jgi:hypothetical protein
MARKPEDMHPACRVEQKSALWLQHLSTAIAENFQLKSAKDHAYRTHIACRVRPAGWGVRGGVDPHLFLRRAERLAGAWLMVWVRLWPESGGRVRSSTIKEIGYGQQ